MVHGGTGMLGNRLDNFVQFCNYYQHILSLDYNFL